MLKFAVKFIFILLLSIVSSSISTAGETYLADNLLVFENGGYFYNKIVSGESVLYTGNTKGIHVVSGNYISNSSDEKTSLHTVTDTLTLNHPDDETTSSHSLFVGNYMKSFTVIEGSTLGAREYVTSGDAFIDSELKLQDNNGITHIGYSRKNISGSDDTFDIPIIYVNGYTEEGDDDYQTRVGINTSTPGSALYVSGDIKIEGTLQATAGTFLHDTATDYTDGSSGSPVANFNFSVSKINQNVLAIGVVSGIATGNNPNAQLFVYNTSDSTTVFQSVKAAFKKGSNGHYTTLMMSVGGELPIGSYSASLYTHALGITTAESSNLVVLGLPNDTLPPNYETLPAYEEALTQIYKPETDVLETFLTEDQLAMRLGANFVAYGDDLYLVDANNTGQGARFYAENITANELHFNDILDVKVNSTTQLIVDNIEFAVITTTAAETITHNIFTANDSSTLTFDSPLYVSNGGLYVGTTVGINTDTPNTDYALDVNGDLSYTGAYIGSYGVVAYQKMTADTGNIPKGSQTNIHTLDIDLGSSGDNITWKVLIMSTASLEASGGSRLLVQTRLSFDGDYSKDSLFEFSSDNPISTLSNIYFTTTGVASGTHTANLYVQNQSDADLECKAATDSDSDYLGADILIIAIPEDGG